MFNKNKKQDKEKRVFVDLREYEALEKSKIDQNLRFYEEKQKLDTDRHIFDLKKEATNSVNEAFFEDKKEALKKKEEILEEISNLKTEATELEAKNRLTIDTNNLLKDKYDLKISSKEKEIELLKENRSSALKDKNDVIELLKTQVEVLTAKLTEIKISDAHIHVDTTTPKK